MSTAAVVSREQTLNNLCIAFNGESNAAARYAAFAQKADEEGYRMVGSLFRAASCSEQIHAANHAAAMLKMGSTHHPTIEPIAVKSTVENLKAAIAGELYEVEKMYPEFIRDTDMQALGQARRSFQFALACEKIHHRLFTQALQLIEKSYGAYCEMVAQAAAYYVCPICGFTAAKSEFDRCPACGHPRDCFELIS